MYYKIYNFTGQRSDPDFDYDKYVIFDENYEPVLFVNCRFIFRESYLNSNDCDFLTDEEYNKILIGLI
jgi:hypothetical protein